MALPAQAGDYSHVDMSLEGGDEQSFYTAHEDDREHFMPDSPSDALAPFDPQIPRSRDPSVNDAHHMYWPPTGDQPPPHPPVHQDDSVPRSRVRGRRRSTSQPIQINGPNMHAAPHSPGPTIGDTMQMMMLNQMMTQQMTAQQMQAAQMNMLMQQANGARSSSSKRKPAVKIKSRQVSKRQPRPMHVVLPAPQVLPQVPAVEGLDSMAMANWQEATIILCIAIVGLIYLVSSRSTAKDEEDKSAVARHLTTKAK